MASSGLAESVTHGTAAMALEINRQSSIAHELIDLSIGSLDTPTDPRIDLGVAEFIQHSPQLIHAFAPVKGFAFLRESIARKLRRMHGVAVDPEREIIVTSGGVKGALTVMFHTFIDPGDEALVPLPNWPHYGDMLRLHGAVPKFILENPTKWTGLTAPKLEENLTEKSKLLILGDCINPTGKVYTEEELRCLAQVVAIHNVRRATEMRSPLHVVFDCPYEAHVFGGRARTFAAIEVDVPDYGTYSMRQCTSTITGPGKTYGMHGDRIGYVWADPDTIELAARVQVNTTSFASTYGQIATHLALQEIMDDVAEARAKEARANLYTVLKRLMNIPLLRVVPPDGGYFLFVDFSGYAPVYEKCGHLAADQFLLKEALVATIGGPSFAQNSKTMRHFVRLNCGRSIEVLIEACARIEVAVSRLAAL
jgi:aspartate aminotransferase